MHGWIPFWPRTAAINGVLVDNLYIAELALCGLILLTVCGMMLTFCIRYRRGSLASRAAPLGKTWRLEIGWTSATFVAFLGLFVWGVSIYLWLYKPPPSDLDIYVVGKQWMWKFQHPGGQREIDALHVPVGKTVRLVLASQDVIHSFFVPAFRIKHDAIPGAFETVWFKATHTGSFRLECSEFCGTQHAHMGGEIVALEPAAYTAWLAAQGVHDSLAQQGEAVFRARGCSGCHGANSTVHAPALEGLYGTLVHLQDGSVRLADEQFIRDCIVLPRSFTVAGYPPVMPSFAGQLSEGELLQLIAYIKSLGSKRETAP